LREKGSVIAIDLLEMEPLPGVEFHQGDFNEIDQYLTEKVDVILSDMAPSSCGIKSVDHDRIMGMLEDVYAFALIHLAPKGSLVAKVLRGGTERTLLTQIKANFEKVSHFKPQSSRSESTEIYVIAQGFRSTSSTKSKT
jgi:23S rRNA (uridine2552-2'-O)-methyltransferase